ncbi:cytochrome d ubiquinol oxidase subunit II [Kineococcus sp. LSe6-4]|uniref:Cytochrome d ubiquinol oxidase subunit II n=1 Tax=Kineococcus halophytocola TaxID=3234027 RepID=A0ABV4GYH7_9ACTN
MELTTVWFVLIALLWTGYLVLEGFDFGVGMLLAPLSRDDTERRTLLATIGPVWDGNEVWLLVAGGATFAAFPEWYASMFSGFYLALLVVLVALILRAVAFEFRGKVDDPVWRARWDRCIAVGSWVPPLVWGVAFANLVRGVPMDAGHRFTGTLLTLLNPYALLGGLALLTVFLAHGATFLALRTLGEVRARAARAGHVLTPLALVVAGSWAVVTQVRYGAPWTWAAVAVAAAGLAGAVLAGRRRREGRAFAATALAIVAVVVLVFGSLFPAVMPSSTDAASSLTVDNASSSHYTLVVMTWVAAFLTPLVLLYQGWTYWVFRRRTGVHHIPAPAGLPARTAGRG